MNLSIIGNSGRVCTALRCCNLCQKLELALHKVMAESSIDLPFFQSSDSQPVGAWKAQDFKYNLRTVRHSCFTQSKGSLCLITRFGHGTCILTACKFLRLLGAEAKAHPEYSMVPDHSYSCTIVQCHSCASNIVGGALEWYAECFHVWVTILTASQVNEQTTSSASFLQIAVRTECPRLQWNPQWNQ
jgi:hypothetical protein